MCVSRGMMPAVCQRPCKSKSIVGKCAHVALLICCMCAMEKGKVDFLSGVSPLTTEVSQLNCSHNAQTLVVHMLVCASVFHFAMRMHVSSCMMTHANQLCEDGSCQSQIEHASASKAWCVLLQSFLLCWNAGSS